MFETIMLPIRSWKAKKDLEIASAKLAMDQLDEAERLMKEVSTFAKGDPDDKDWIIQGQSGSITDYKAITEDSLAATRSQSRKFYRYDPHGRAIIRSICKFVIGRGVTFAMKFEKEESDTILKKYQEYWDEFVRREHFFRKQKEFVRRYTRDGEVFMRFFVEKDGLVRIRFMEPDRVANPSQFSAGKIAGREVRGNLSYGIETSRRDVETVFNYYYITSEDLSDKTKFVRVPAKDVIHKKLYADSDCKRGFPFLEPLLYEIKAYNDWLKDRIILNKIRTAVGLVREIPVGTGPKDQIGQMREAQKATKAGWDNSKMQLLKPGTILTARGVEYKFLSPELDAKDSAQDGRNILLSLAAGSGLPEYMVSGDASNSNYSSSMVAESPAVKEFEDLQDDLKDAFLETFDRVITAGIEAGKLPKPKPKAELVFPSLIARDIKKEADANVVYNQQKILSKKTIRGRIGADNDVEDKNIKKELEYENTLPLPKLPEPPASMQADPAKTKPADANAKARVKPAQITSDPTRGKGGGK